MGAGGRKGGVTKWDTLTTSGDAARLQIPPKRGGVAPFSTAMRLSGHLTESTYTRYAISSQSDMEAGVAKIAALRAARAKRTG